MISHIADLRVRAEGAAGPSVVFAVDPPNALEHYDALFSRLAAYRRFAFELPGFGGSPRDPAGFGFEAMFAATTRLLDALAAGPYILAFGCAAGHLARAVAARRPELVRALFYQQTATWSEQRRWAERLDPRRVLRTPLLGQAMMRLRLGPVARGWYGVAVRDPERRRALDDLAQRRLRAGARFPLASMFQSWFSGTVADPVAAADAPAQPATIVWGLDDRSHRRTDRAASATLAPGSALTELPGVGHFFELEDPSGFERRLDALADLSRA